MKTELIDVSPTRKEIKIEIEPELLRTTFDRISDQYAKLASVPGFRKGHAPRTVVQTRFKSEIRGEVLRELVPNAINEAIDSHQLTTIGEPDVQFDEAASMNKFGEQPFSVKVNVEILPKVELGEYKGLAADRSVRPIKDSDIDQMIESLREASASLQPVEDRAAETGDTLTVDFNGKFVDDPEAEDIEVSDVDVELGGKGVQPEFTENLIGVKPDDERSFTVDYPADFSARGLAGKKVDYTAKVTAVRRKELPDTDDEWAKSLGDQFDSIATLRTKIREDLENRATAEASHKVRGQIIRKLLEAHPFEAPETLIEHQTNIRFEELVRDMIARNVDVRNADIDWQRARAELKTQAAADVRTSLLLESIARKEGITVSDEEVEAEINALAVASRQPLEQIRATLTKEGGERSIANTLRNRKALDLLIENAQVTEQQWREEKDEEPEAKDD
jgi:trigger factor